VEDLAVVFEGVRSWISDDPERRVSLVAAADTVEAVLEGPGHDADVLVLDLELRNRQMVTGKVAELSDAGHRVVIYSIHVQPLIVQSVLQAGACAFLDKHTERDQFVDTIVAVAQGRPIVTASMAGGILQAAKLAAREREALLYLFQGMSYASIAARMKISRVTVKQYVERARAKFAALGRPCRANTVLLARCIEDGLIRPEEVREYRSAARRVAQPPSEG
jgi:DNA-binding NarL/FixJ family response regulator